MVVRSGWWPDTPRQARNLCPAVARERQEFRYTAGAGVTRMAFTVLKRSDFVVTSEANLANGKKAKCSIVPPLFRSGPLSALIAHV